MSRTSRTGQAELGVNFSASMMLYSSFFFLLLLPSSFHCSHSVFYS